MKYTPTDELKALINIYLNKLLCGCGAGMCSWSALWLAMPVHKPMPVRQSLIIILLHNNNYYYSLLLWLSIYGNVIPFPKTGLF